MSARGFGFAGRVSEILIIGTPQIGNAVGGNVTLTFDVPPVENDLVLLIGGYRGGNDAGQGAVGYTPYFTRNGGANQDRYVIATKRMTSSPDSNVVGLGVSGAAVCYAAYVLRGVHPDIWDAAFTEASGSTTNPDAPAIITATNSARVFATAFSNIIDNSVTAPVGFSNHVTTSADSSQDFTLAACQKLIELPGVEDPPSWTNWSSSIWRCVTLAIKPV